MSLVQSIFATAEREAILEMKVDGLPVNWQLTSTSFDFDDLKAQEVRCWRSSENSDSGDN